MPPYEADTLTQKRPQLWQESYVTSDGTSTFVCEFFPISETVLSGSHIASSSARVSACLELPQQLRQLGDIAGTRDHMPARYTA
jgi:hypothetical protein